MMLSVVLTADQFATHESAAGRHPEDIAFDLASVPYRLDENTARVVAYTSWRDRRGWEQWVAHELGFSAVDAEFDLDASTFPTVPRPPEPDREQTAQDAYLVAVRARDALGMDGADLIVLVVQAFLLDMDVAADVALAASQGHELATVDLKL